MNISRILKVSLVMLLAALLTGCAQKQPASFSTLDLNPKLKSGDYLQTTENFLVILDASSTMFESPRTPLDSTEGVANPSKFVSAKALIRQMNRTIPDIPLQGALRTFGPNPAAESLVYGLIPYTKADLAAAVDGQNTADGTSPLEKALAAAKDDLADSTTGRIAVIVFSDGKWMAAEEVLEAAAGLRSQYGSRLCIYTVLMGEDPGGKELLTKLAAADGCGFATTAAAINSGAGMAGFVEKIFLAADGDDDRDGVRNSRDECPNTLYGLKVDSKGCRIEIMEPVSINLLVNFDFDKADVKPIYHDRLRAVADFMKKYPRVSVFLKGYTCSMGPARYNLGLSQRRADSIRNYLIKEFGINGTRLRAKGYGEANPVASNDTREGRIKNRRVTATISTVVEE
ncbi:MAG: OmpA family protein [Desulfobacterales bacterium]|nr:OmpA family protein [Desulfobacterales bacterium]